MNAQTHAIYTDSHSTLGWEREEPLARTLPVKLLNTLDEWQSKPSRNSQIEIHKPMHAPSVCVCARVFAVCVCVCGRTRQNMLGVRGQDKYRIYCN